MSDFSVVNHRLATGAAISGEPDVEALVAAGVRAVLDARAEFDDAQLFVAHPEILYCWNPTADDGQRKPPEYFRKTLEFALPFLARPAGKLYAHCAAGSNRGPSNAAAVMIALGWTAEGARAAIQAARPQAEIRYLADADAAVSALGYG